MSQNLPVSGFGGPLGITEGFGRSGATIDYTPGPGEIILNHASRALSLLVTQFRRLRVVSNDPVYGNLAAPDHTPVSPVPAASAVITDHRTRGLSLLVTQFRRLRG